MHVRPALFRSISRFAPALAAVVLALALAGNARAANTAPNIGSGISVSPSNKVFAGQLTTLLLAAFDAEDFNNLTYKFDFGDGQSESNFTALGFRFHTYTAAGVYTVTVVVKDTGGLTTTTSTVMTVTNTLVGTGPDSDGDGFSDAFEDEVGSDKSSQTVTPLGSTAANPARILPFGITKSSIALNFQKSGSDTIKLSGDLYDFGVTTTNGKTVTVDIGGIVRKFPLDAKGSGKLNSDTLKINGKFGVNNIGVKNGTFKVAITLAKSDYATTLADEGLTSAATPGKTVVIPVTLIFDGSVFKQNLQLKYTNKTGAAGMAK